MKIVSKEDRTTKNKIILTIHIFADIAIVFLIFLLLGEHYLDTISNRFLWDASSMLGFVGILGTLVLAVNGFILAYTFPTHTKDGLKLVAGKIAAITLLFLGTNDIAFALFMYALTELIAQSLGLGISLIIARAIIPGALTFMDTLPKNPTVIDKAKVFFFNAEFIPALLFGIPLVIWSAGLFKAGFILLLTDTSTTQSLLHIAVWLLALLPLMRDRYNYPMMYFRTWYKNANKRVR